MTHTEYISRERRVAQILALGILILYAKVVFFDFVSFDDAIYVTDNEKVLSGVTMEGLRWAFSLHTKDMFWIPVTQLSLMLDASLFGSHAAGYHLVNVFFHIANALLLFYLLRRLTDRFWESAWVAALFAVHPQHVEAVAWVVERKEVLAAFFGLLTLGQYARYVDQRNQGQDSVFFLKNTHYLLALFLFMCSLWSKAMWVTLPAVFLLLDGWPLQRLSREKWRYLLWEKLPFLVPVGLVVGMTLWRTNDPLLKFTWEKLPLTARLGNMLVSLTAYVRQTVWPSDLAVFYPHPYLEDTPPSTLELAIGAGLLLVLSGLVVALLKTRPYLFVGWFWFLGGLVPVSGIAQSGRQGMADRFAYYPHIGLFVAVVWGVAALIPHRQSWRRLLLPVGVGVLLALMVVTWRQLDVWFNSGTVWSHAVRVTRNNSYAHCMLAGYYMETGNHTLAHAHIDEALRLRPLQVDFILSKAMFFFREGRMREFLDWVYRAEMEDPKAPNVILFKEKIILVSANLSQAYATLSSRKERASPDATP
ncbi:MAG: hypothetical protein HQL64_07235 [Magnetococcales bacterium]|nr:hypothetical protein [Magnetococcales bacterium]